MAGNSDEQAELTRRLKMVIAAVTEATEHIDSPDIDRRAKAAISSCKACQAASETVFPGIVITTGDGRDGGLDAAGEQRLREELLGRLDALAAEWEATGVPEFAGPGRVEADVGRMVGVGERGTETA